MCVIVAFFLNERSVDDGLTVMCLCLVVLERGHKVDEMVTFCSELGHFSTKEVTAAYCQHTIFGAMAENISGMFVPC